MRLFFSEVVHKLLVAIVGVGAGIGAYWYHQTHGQNLWILAGIAAAGTLVIGLLFHPFLWMFRHRPRRHAEAVEVREG